MRLKDLSAYTIAKNCTDTTDIEYGIIDMNKFINWMYESGDKTEFNKAYIRLYHLRKKQRKLLSKTKTN